jgi:hypothetical protein
MTFPLGRIPTAISNLLAVGHMNWLRRALGLD